MSHGLGRDGWPSNETVIKNRDAEIESLRRQLKHMTDQYNAALEAEQVRYQQVVEKDAEIERLNSKLQKQALDCIAADGQAFDSWQQLAASQAREQQLREALEGAYDYVEEAINRRIEEYGETFRPHRLEYIREVKAAADKALALPKDTTAMSAMIAKAGEMMRERTHSAMLDLKPWDHRGEIIRALPAVTIDDLKCSN